MRTRPAGEQIEQIRDVLAERLTAREQPEVAVHTARPRVVVARGEVTVAANAVGLLSNDEAGLTMNLQAGAAVDHVRPHLLERASPPDVRRLVEASLEL